MKHEFVVWTDRTRLPTISDVVADMKTGGYDCRVEEIHAGKSDPAAWAELKLETGEGPSALNCQVVTSVPTRAEIEQLRETYELIPFQIKNAARRYTISSEEDDYGQVMPFHGQAVVTMARLSRGVIDDPREGGLMMLEEFEAYLAS
ncbi:MAG: hypothetical protein HY650_00465 [Acidobacteria bacterium]|nr:hypothetical protein [Acidobacteriota bacterium]